MTTNKDVKRVIRTRMKKTGESYTAARSVILRKGKTDRTTAATAARGVGSAAAESTKVSAKEYAALSGYSDAVIKARTGCTWKSWVGALDYAGGREMTHGAIAKHLRDAHKLSSWWAQAVTVGYERITGLREKGQRRDGLYEVSVSKTVPVSVGELYRAFHEPAQRVRWLKETGLRVRTTVENKSVRMTWSDRTSVEVYFTAKGPAKSTVSVQHVKLPAQDDRETRRAYWKERLTRLTAYLSVGKS